MKNLLCVFCLILLTHYLFSQNIDQKYATDVSSIDAIIEAYYDVVSGSSDDPWEFDRDKYIHSPNALIIKLDEDGTVDEHSLEAEYIPMLSQPRSDFYEREVHRITHQYGNLAQVWSTFEISSSPDGPAQLRGISSIQLYYSNDRWWVASWMSQYEGDDKIPEEFLGE